jgi:glutamyl-tRNA reductase
MVAGIAQNPAASREPVMALLALGLNHATAPLDVRERVTIGADALPDALGELCSQSGVQEAAILSTCNRTEIYCALGDADAQQPLDWFCAFHGLKDADLKPYVYAHPDARAVKHVLRVASGLDSMVLGEPQVLGQLKSAYQSALQAGSVGRFLNRLFQYSFRVAKEVRSTTAIGRHPVSVAYASVRLAQQIFGDLAQHTALLIGAGETIELTARHLAENGLRRMIIANRSLERSQRLASAYSGYAIALSDLDRHLYEADIVISATASPVPLVGPELVTAALERRRRRPMFIVDIAVPRDVDPAVAELEDVYLYTVDDLKGVIEENVRSRREAAERADEIIDNQVVHFMNWVESQDAVGTIRAIRGHAARVQAELLEAATRRLRAGDNPEQVLADLSRTLANRLIHPPSSQLRNAGREGRDDLLRAARELFNLPPARDSSSDES